MAKTKQKTGLELSGLLRTLELSISMDLVDSDHSEDVKEFASGLCDRLRHLAELAKKKPDVAVELFLSLRQVP